MTHADRQAAKSDSGDKAAKKNSRPAPVASTTTDKDGKFELADVPAGKYVVMARVKDVGAARQEIEVKSGEPVKVDLQLKERKAGKKEEKKAE
jgi:hypothetical protein